MKTISFGEWLESKLAERGMRQADLVRTSGMDSAVISNLVNNKRNPGMDSCKAIASSLKIPLPEVLRAAGIMEPDPTADPITETISHLVKELSTDEKRDVLEYVRLRHKLASDKKDEHPRTRKRATRGHAAT